MLKLATIGSMIVCHLMSGNPASTQSGEKDQIKKVLGQIIDIQSKEMYYEDLAKKEVKSFNQKFLIVKEKNSNQIYEINSSACMTIRQETEKEEKERLYGKPIIKKVEVSYDEKGNKIAEKDFIKDKVLEDLKQVASELPINKKDPETPKDEKKEDIDLNQLEKELQK